MNNTEIAERIMNSMNAARRKTDTLARWWWKLNHHGWPKEMLQHGEPHCPRLRIYMMDQIQLELGHRIVMEHRHDP